MARYTPEFLARLRARYEQTDQPMIALSADFGIGISTLSALVEREGWLKRSLRQRDRPQRDLIQHAERLIDALPARGVAYEAPSPAVPLSDEGSPAARLEALIVKEIEAEEAARADLDAMPRLRSEAERCARTLATLTQTLQTLQKLRAEERQRQKCESCCCEDMPEDIDAFREALAQRIETFFSDKMLQEDGTIATASSQTPSSG